MGKENTVIKKDLESDAEEAENDMMPEYSDAEDRKKVEEIAENYRKTIKANPADIDANLMLAVAVHVLEQYEEAEKEYKKVIEINPNHKNVYGNLGALLSSLERYDEARRLPKGNRNRT